MSLGTTYFPAVPVRGVKSYKLWPVITYSNGYWEVYGRFQGDFFLVWEGELRWGVKWEDLSIEELLMGEETFNEGGAGFFSIILKNNEKINMKSIET